MKPGNKAKENVSERGLWERAVARVIMADRVWQTGVAIAIVAFVILASIGFSREASIGFGCLSAVVGILWLLHSSERLRIAWRLEKRAEATNDEEHCKQLLKEAARNKELRSVDITWAQVSLLIAALVFALIGLFG